VAEGIKDEVGFVDFSIKENFDVRRICGKEVNSLIKNLLFSVFLFRGIFLFAAAFAAT